MEQVILVDSKDNPIGTMEKMEAHERGVLHRAFSVIVFNDLGQMMLQRRADEKYHSGGLWTNTCCSHPRPGESVEAAAHRRLQEEMGFDCELTHQFHFLYRSELDHDLVEYELDHVLTGKYEDEPELNPEEASDFRWATAKELQAEIAQNPDEFTEWFKILLPRLVQEMNPAVKSA